MRNFLILIFLFPFQLFSQQTDKWIYQLENPEIDIWELKSQNAKIDFQTFDFASLIKPNTNFLGFIGPKYKRIKMDFVSVEKNTDNPLQYDIVGYSVVGTNKYDFEGNITIEQIREFKNMHYGVDEMYKDSNIQTQGLLICNYAFRENPKQKHVGTFTGVYTLWWYLDNNNKIHFDNIKKYSDSYKNNQFVGIWTEYGKSQSKICNWGEYRIPFSGDLDIGAGEFSVNPKYLENGWIEFK